MNWLADHSIRVAALMLVVGAGSMVARRASAHSRLFAWTTVLYIAAAMPLLAAVLPAVAVPVAANFPVIVVPSHDSVALEPAVHAGAAAGANQSSPALPWLLASYLIGVGFLFSRLVAGTRQTARVLRRARPVDDTTLVAEVQSLSAAMRLPGAPRLVQHESVHVPFVCGLFRPALVLPDSWTLWDAATRRAVLTHELSHVSRRDLWTMRAAALYRAATWINPMSWWLSRKLETLAERASDDVVLASGVEPTAYAEILVQFFDAAQRAPGRASWQLAMARRSGVEAQKRVGRVLNASEGGSVRFGLTGRVLVGVAVVLAAVPAIVLSATRLDAVAIQSPPAVTQAEVRITQPERRTIVLPVEQIRRIKVDSKPMTLELSLPTVPVNVTPVDVILQGQEQEPEPWRSTRKATDADVVAPRATNIVNPKYTPEALRAKIQGMVAVELIVSPEGNVTAARVIKSLDKDFGLDEEALKAAREWKFIPGTYQGQAVAMRVMVDLQFTVR